MPFRRFCAVSIIVLYAGLAFGQKDQQPQSQGDTVAVIDTTMGRLWCSLYERERPATVALFVGLADGTREWVDPGSGRTMRGQPFYNGTRLFSIPAGIRGGSRLEDVRTSKDVGVPVESGGALTFDRPGRLAMRHAKGHGETGEFMILDHANAEDDGDSASIFGECDGASVAIVTAIAHRLASADNDPSPPVAVNRVTIVRKGALEPKVVADVAESSIVPKLQPLPKRTVAAPEPTGPTAVFETTMGRLVCKLFTKESPIATGVFMGLADGSKEWTNPVTHEVERGKRFYDGMIFDRVIPDFVIQTGDYTGDISGGTDIGFRFKKENTPGLNFDRPGRLAFGNNGPDTNNSELFIAEHPMHRLDGGFPIIGQCDDASLRVVASIARVPRGADNRPLKPVVIERVSIISP